MEVEVLASIPSTPGSYALRLALAQPVRLEIGRLGAWDFPAGDYLYLGSAQGPGGLRARLRHHARLAVRPHWHLDWLRPHAAILGGWYATGPGALECLWSKALLRLPGAQVPCPGFGASDCRLGCPAHLLAFPRGVALGQVEEELQRMNPLTRAWTLAMDSFA